MKSATLKLGFVSTLISVFAALSSSVALAIPSACSYDCEGHSKTRHICGFNITWNSQSNKMCEKINYPEMWACEAARSIACKLGGALVESGPDGPKMHYERFQLLPYEKLFNDDANNSFSYLTRTVNYFNFQMTNSNSLRESFNTTLGSEGENANVLLKQAQEFSNWAKWAGIVCVEQDYLNMKDNMPFYYLKQIPLADFCKKRWQHLSNNWANGFERNRSRTSCESSWALQGVERAPLTFTCANRKNSFEYLRRYVETQSAPVYEDYATASAVSTQEFLQSVNWNETREVKNANKEVSEAEATLFGNQAKQQMFEVQLELVNRQIAAEEKYKKDLELKLGRILGFVESYKTFIDSEAEKLAALESKFLEIMLVMKDSLAGRTDKVSRLESYVNRLDTSVKSISTQVLVQLPQLQAKYDALRNDQYQALCISNEMQDLILRLQSIQAYRIDLADRLVSSVEYFEDSAEFNDAKAKFTVQAEKLSKAISEKNYVFNASFDVLKKTPEVCRKFENVRLILETLSQVATNNGSVSEIGAIRSAFASRLSVLKDQQKLLEQKTKVRNQVYAIMKDLEDNFNSGYLTQLYKEHATARSRIVAAGDYAKAVLKRGELRSLQGELDTKLAYFDQRSPAYIDMQQGRLKLQDRLNRFINSVADFKDQASDEQLRAIAADVESFLPIIFSYNPDRVTAVIPETANISELSGFDSFLSDVEQRFSAIREVSK